MKKPDALRAWMAESLPRLAAEPDRLVILYDSGAIKVGMAKQSLSLLWTYSLEAVLLDLPKTDMAQAFVAVSMWVGRYQRELLQAGTDLVVDVDPLDDLTVDLKFTLPLSERIRTIRRDDGRFDVEVLDEPTLADAPDPLDPVWASFPRS